MKWIKIIDEDIYDAMSGILFTSRVSTKRIEELSDKHVIELLYKVRDASNEYWRKTRFERKSQRQLDMKAMRSKRK